MQRIEELDSGAIERLRKQGEFLLRIYRAEFVKDPTSRAAESSRSNVIAIQHTVRQMYGEAVVRDVANLGTATTGECLQSGTNHSLSHICDLIRCNFTRC